MRQYSRDQIDKMLQPLMRMMKTQYPNDAVLIVKPDYAEIKYMHTDMNFLEESAWPSLSRGTPTSRVDGETGSEGKKQESLDEIKEALSNVPAKYQKEMGKAIVHAIGVMTEEIKIVTNQAESRPE